MCYFVKKGANARPESPASHGIRAGGPKKRGRAQPRKEARMDDAGRWVLCPVCGGKTRVKVRRDTVLENFPLYCPKCRNETVIDKKKD